MRRKLSLSILILIYASMTAALVGKAKLEFPHSYFDFGFVPQQSELAHTFWIKSSGDENLVIERIATGCSCTQAPLEKDVIAPGDSASLEIIFSSRRYHERVLKKPLIVTNEGPDGRNVTIIARVVDRPDSTFPIVINPFKLVIEANPDKSSGKYEFSLRNVSDLELSPTLIDFPCDLLTVQLPAKIPAQASATGFVRLTEKGRTHDFAKSFTIELSDDEKTRFSVPVARTIAAQKLNE